jgi:DNA-binding CsgD family transcriptional regulator
MVSLEALSELLEVLYSAPLDQEQWERFLVLVSKHTQSQLGAFLCANSRLGLSILAQGGGTPLAAADISVYNERLGRSDPFRAPILRLGRAGVFQGEDLLPNEGLLSTDLYRCLAAPLGYRYVTAIVLTVSVRRFEVISVWRRIDQGPMGDDGNRLLNLLVPHIQKALEIRQILGIARQRLAGAEAMADASSTATFLLNRQGYVIHRNAAADALVSDRTAFALQDGVLVAANGQSRDPLRALFLKAVSHAYAPSVPAPPHALSLQRTDGRQPLQLLATPLPHTHIDHSGADLLLLVTDPEQSFSYPDSVLRALYGLTPAETEIANGLLTGYSLQEIAALRRVSIGSTRNQLKSVLSKTSAARQSDLMRLLMALPRPPQSCASN